MITEQNLSSSILSNLNPFQIDAVTYPNGPLLILAGAGSGKTRMITRRIAYLIQEMRIHPSNILAVTFTNKAASEMINRVKAIISNNMHELWIGTFHSICLRILKREINKLDGYRRDFVIFDELDQIKLIKECISRLALSENTFSPKIVRSQIDALKSKGLNAGDFGATIYEEKISRIYDIYQSELRRYNALDFGDLLSLTVILFESKKEILDKYQDKFNHILVDEYQDTNHLQYKIVKLLSLRHRNISVVGDDNQSIYGWRGADITNILNFEKDFPDAKVFKLEINYRSTKNILKAANSIIQRNRFRTDKKLRTENDHGDLIIYYEASDEKDEARNVASNIRSEIKNLGRTFKDFAVFYRTNNQSRLIEEELLHSSIPYSIYGGVGFYERMEIKDVIAYLRVISNPTDDMSLKRIINVPPRGIGNSTLEIIEKISKENTTSLFDSIKLALDNLSLNKKALNNLKNFYSMINELIQLSSKLSISTLTRKVLEKTQLLESLKNEEQRRENVGEIINLAHEFEKESRDSSFMDFVDWVSLSSDMDRFNENADRVSLMTLHCAKGLEFPVVFIVGMEEKLLPHFRSIGDGKLIEEERRLCYVGVTRTKEKLYLSSTSSRKNFGVEQRSIPSRFISEIPRELLQWEKYNKDLKETTIASTSSREETDRSENNSNVNGFAVGERVLHRSFGNGVVTKIEGKGSELKVVILFPNHGKKKILASFQGLKKV